MKKGKNIFQIKIISNWIINNPKDTRDKFPYCASLKEMPDISKRNISNVNDMTDMFYLLYKEFPDISKRNTKIFNNVSFMISYCVSLKGLPDIIKWNTKNVYDMDYIFYYCTSIKNC